MRYVTTLAISYYLTILAGTTFRHLLPLPNPHQEFTFAIEGDQVSFLWHIPISDEERNFKQEHGADALLDRMEEVGLPWIFEEANRPSLVD